MVRKTRFLVLLPIVLTTACGASALRARTALELSARGVALGYRATAGAYQARSAEVVRQVQAAHGTYADYVREMRPLTVALDALDMVSETIQAGEQLVAAYSDSPTFQAQWRAWVRGCKAELDVAVRLLNDAGVQIPPEVAGGMRLLADLLGGA